MKQKQQVVKDVMTMSVNTGNVEIRELANSGEEKVIRGYAVVFDDTYTYKDWYGDSWIEKVDRNFFDGVDMSSVVLLRDHDYSRLLGRSGKNLRLEVDEKGLFYECILPNTELAKETYELAKKEICDQCSFGFTVKEEKIDYGNKINILTKCERIYEITITPIPAYKSTVVLTMSDNRHDKLEQTKARQRAEAEKAEADKLAVDDQAKRVNTLVEKIINI